MLFWYFFRFFSFRLHSFLHVQTRAFQKMDEKREINGVKKIQSPCDVEALKKCLEENKGDYVKCQYQIEAFKSSCSLKKPDPSVDSANSTRRI
ncbi:Ribosomal RNA small subunit methyltransferase E [Theobroma cacao]|uniref:Ribosomal RNA small subunit methyltransferase E n=1 Tax=Theobroma cacao TaxID=3641 RepID=A0A061G880_THECC|nr:Ribosomal RNA small subunit methyltransferase E [Theobroma cacao]